MLPDEYLKVLLNDPTNDELDQAKTIISYVITGEKTSQEIENEVMRVHGIDNVKKARASIYKVDEAGLIISRKKKMEADMYPLWIYKVNTSNDFLKQKAVTIECSKIEKIKEKFSENSLVFYCTTFCSPKLYTYEQMTDADGHCPSCNKPSLVSLDDVQKRKLIEKYVSGLANFVDKEWILHDICDKVFPDDRANREGIAPPAAIVTPRVDTIVEDIAGSCPDITGILSMKPVAINDAMKMLRWVTVSCDNDIGISISTTRHARASARSRHHAIA